MDGVRRECHPQLSFVSVDLPDWLPRRRTDQTHRLPLGEQQDMTFLFSFLNTFTLSFPPDIHTRLTLFISVEFLPTQQWFDESAWLFERPLLVQPQASCLLSPTTVLHITALFQFASHVLGRDVFGNRQELVKLRWREDISWNGPTCSLSDAGVLFMSWSCHASRRLYVSLWFVLN